MYPKRQAKTDQERFYDAFHKKVGTTPEIYLRRKLAAGVPEAELQRLYDMLAVEIARKVRCTAIRFVALRPQITNTAQRHQEQAAAEEVPACPRCGARMVRRTHQSGAGKGNPFWGCSNFPACRGKREIGGTR